MAEGMNGALLALGVVGAVAAAGRVARGSFARDWRPDARHLLALSEEEGEVDSGDLSDLLERIVEDRSVTGHPRSFTRRVLAAAKEDSYLDTGDALWAIQKALSGVTYDMGPINVRLDGARFRAAGKPRGGSNMGSLAQAGENKAKTEYRSLYHGHRKKAYNLFPWNLKGPVDDHLRWRSSAPPANKQSKGGSRAQRSGGPRYVAIVTGRPLALPANVSHDYELSRQHARKTLGTEHVELMEGRAGGSRAVGVDAHNPKSRAEYIAYLDDLAQRARNGKLTLDEHSRWSYRAGVSPYDHHTVAEQLLTKAVLTNIATEREWISTWSDRNPGTDRGSRAFTLDDPEYTHYVVHTPSMKIASGWSYAEDAKEALADMGMAKSHCKVYTRKYLRDNGRDPRHNGSWASRGQF